MMCSKVSIKESTERNLRKEPWTNEEMTRGMPRSTDHRLVWQNPLVGRTPGGPAVLQLHLVDFHVGPWVHSECVEF
jgi:hypothetical protein